MLTIDIATILTAVGITDNSSHGNRMIYHISTLQRTYMTPEFYKPTGISLYLVSWS